MVIRGHFGVPCTYVKRVGRKIKGGLWYHLWIKWLVIKARTKSCWLGDKWLVYYVRGHWNKDPNWCCNFYFCVTVIRVYDEEIILIVFSLVSSLQENTEWDIKTVTCPIKKIPSFAKIVGKQISLNLLSYIFWVSF